MVASGTVAADKQSFVDQIKKCPDTFNELNSVWQGHSYKGISETIEAFVGETDIVSAQMDKLIEVCKYYESYRTQLDSYIAAYNAAVDYQNKLDSLDKDSKDYDAKCNEYHAKIAEENAKMKACIVNMQQIVHKAQGVAGTFNNGKVTTVNFQPVNVEGV